MQHHLPTISPQLSTPPQTASTIHSIPRSQAYCLMLGVLQTNYEIFTQEKTLILSLSQKHTDTKLMVPNHSVFRRELRDLHAGENIDIIAVTETHRYKTNGPQSFCLQERQKLVRGRDYNMLLVRNNIPATRLHDLETDCQSELLYMGGNKSPYTIS